MLLALTGAGCSGGGGTSPSLVTPTSLPSVTPVTTPTVAPSNGPSPTAHGRAIAGSIGKAGQILPQSVGRRSLALNVRGVPTIVESQGDFGVVTGVDVWEYDTTTLAPIADGTPAITNADAHTTILSVSPITVAGFTDAFDGAIQPVTPGLSSVNVAFTNASGSFPVYIYAGSGLQCGAGSVGYAMVGGALVEQSSAAASDFYLDCTNTNNPVLTFRLGAQGDGSPVADAYGSVLTALTSVLTAPGVTAVGATTFPQTTTQQGQIIIFKTAEGPLAKYMVGNPETGTEIFGLVQEASIAGAFAY